MQFLWSMCFLSLGAIWEGVKTRLVRVYSPHK